MLNVVLSHWAISFFVTYVAALLNSITKTRKYESTKEERAAISTERNYLTLPLLLSRFSG
jgi:hypothetical protein